jgi:hypothetical protein
MPACLPPPPISQVCLKAAPQKSTPHGGGGFLLSIGLLRKISSAVARKVVANTWGCSGSDCLVSHILWSQGHYFTDPGPGMFTPDRQVLLFDGLNRERLEACHQAIDSGRAAVAGPLPWQVHQPARCRWSLMNGVSAHVHARNMSGVDAAVHEVAQTHLLYNALLQRVQAEVEGGKVAGSRLELMAEVLGPQGQSSSGRRH